MKLDSPRGLTTREDADMGPWQANTARLLILFDHLQASRGPSFQSGGVELLRG